MQKNEAEPSREGNAQGESVGIGAPSISLPKGGGAIRGLGEKFGANPVTGTGSMTVPIATSPGRSGFGPQLSLSYDSGSGNGPFGFGWSLSLPSITRKTEKGLPQYRDAEESDVFILSGAEDLVPVFKKDANGNWVSDAKGNLVIDEDVRDGYTIRKYRPRIEGLFARIERWTRQNDGDVHWRSLSKDNITTFYGKAIIRTAAQPRSEIADPRIADPADPARIFSWLICESYDDKGNAILYEYKAEDSDGIDLSSSANERNRTPSGRTANRYLKRIKYGNATPRNPNEDLVARTDWLFESVLDYGEHYTEDAQGQPTDIFLDDTHRSWDIRQDPFSIYRAGFEVRTYRLCRRALMFHHFATELGTPDYLVRTTEFQYQEGPVASFITAVTQGGFVRRPDGSYLKKSMPPVEFEYSQVEVSNEVREIDPDSLENLPYGLDGSQYQWVDLDGEGVSGILTEQGDAWYYKPSLGDGRFGPVETVARRPSLAELRSGRQQFLDLAGDGQLDLVTLEAPTPGFFERTEDQDWNPFVPFRSLPNLAWRDPNLRFVDLTGDGHADVLVTEDDAFVWYASLAEDGFAPAEKARQVLDEEKGPRLVFADGTQSIYLADLSGDGLSDLVRLRNGEVCFWPNLGYCRFGAKVTMDNAPWFDNPDQFDQKRIRLADIDGSGTTDIIYLGRDGVRLYFNQSGNRWSDAGKLEVFPQFDDLKAVAVSDLLGNGTACLVWSSPLPGDARRPMRYVDLMGGQKPHLLVKSVNNLGAETLVQYAASTQSYLEDKRNGKPWITRLPFPVHVVERVETYDGISRNRFVTTYKYHHGYFDGFEREFRGFGMVEQRDTGEFEALAGDGNVPPATNIDGASHVPPVLTRTWFHTGFYLDRDRISNFFAGLLDANDAGEYYREPGLTDAQARQLLLDDTVLPAGLTIDEEREACRALKGSMLRQEVYALDGSDKEKHPYTVTEQNFTSERLQPKATHRHGVFFAHPREAVSYHYERDPADPRIGHALTLEVDRFGNVLKSASVGYGRRNPDPELAVEDQKKQTRILVMYTENRYTNSVDTADAYRTPLPCESGTYELTGYPPTGSGGRFQMSDFVQPDLNDPNHVKLIHIFDGEIGYEESPSNGKQRRLIEQVRTNYRPDDLGVGQNDPLALLLFGTLEPLALPGETYKLAFTAPLAKQVFVDSGKLTQADLDAALADEGKYVHSEGDANWWIPSGRVFYSSGINDAAAAELARASQHFFLPRRYRDPFHTNTVSTEGVISYDAYDLLIVDTLDPLGNRVTVGERDAAGNIDLNKPGNDYRVLQPSLVTDPNRNRVAVTFDALGMVVGTAVMGKSEDNPSQGDLLDASFEADLTQAQIDGFYDVADPHVPAPSRLQGATTRIIYDLDRFRRTQQAHPEDPTQWLPVYAATLARETHVSDPLPPQGLKIQISFSYSDGFGREIQKKIQAEPGPAADPRWVGSGWTIFNNKGKPIRQYEPFFSQLPTKGHQFEFGVQIGVSPILCYDPVERVVATVHPNHTYDKVVFDPWRQDAWDVNDTVLQADPKIDLDVGDFFQRLPDDDYLPTWYAQRANGAIGPQEQEAATKAAAHANTPTTAYLDALGRTFLTVADNAADGKYATRVELDIEGNQRSVTDALGRKVMVYDYDMLSKRIHQASMEAGEQWLLNDVAGKAIRAWDSRGHNFRTAYDALRRPTDLFVLGTDPNNSDPRTLTGEVLFDKTVYGEGQPNDQALNLRTRAFKHYDTAGVVTSMGHNATTNKDEAYDFKGNLLRSSRQLLEDYKSLPDWPGAMPNLRQEAFTTSTQYDALNRAVATTTPDASVIRPTYNEANLLERVDINLRGAKAATPFVANIDYNAKGQRELIEYGNGAKTDYTYDPQTFRLTDFVTRRDAASFPNDCPQPPNPPCGVQNLHYVYDPVGNITSIRDDAQRTIFFDNAKVEPSANYTYDAIYRLIAAAGREHQGQLAQPQTTWDDTPRMNQPLPTDGQAIRNYSESYAYDAVGNFAHLVHQAANGNWTRTYTYNEPSLIEPGQQHSNRLTSAAVGASTDLYQYDAHGNVTRMPHLTLMQWDHRNQLQATSKQAVNSGTPETTYYVYDFTGQRVRKATESAGGVLLKERIYVAGFEIYREYEADGTTVSLERQTLHVMDDKRRLAMVETKTVDSSVLQASLPITLTRYQLDNHLGSAVLELDDLGMVISYEEYYPYGSTSYQAVRQDVEVNLKRYRYTGKERDEETGFYYHGARYYAPWLGRWTSADPEGIREGPNAYIFVSNGPLRLVDPSGRNQEQPQGALIDPTVAKRYAEGAQQIIKHWDELKPVEREEKIRALVNSELAASGVPALAHEAFDPTQRAAAHFTSETWSMSINPQYLEGSRQQMEDAAEGNTGVTLGNVFSAFVHEARHAEQRFLAARYLAGTGLNAREISDILDIPGPGAAVPVSEAALSQKLDTSSRLGRWAEYLYSHSFSRVTGAEQYYSDVESVRVETAGAYTRAKESFEKARTAWLTDPFYEKGKTDQQYKQEMTGAKTRMDIALRERHAAWDVYYQTPREHDVFAAQIGVARLLGASQKELNIMRGIHP